MLIIPQMWAWIIIIVVSFIALTLGILLYFFKRGSDRTSFLYWDSNESCKMVSKDTKGKEEVSIEDKKFNLSDAKPKIYKGFFGDRRFFELHYDFSKPLKHDFEKGKVRKEELKPKALQSIVEMSVLDKFLRMAGMEKGTLDAIQVGIGAVIGLMIGLVVHFAGVLPT